MLGANGKNCYHNRVEQLKARQKQHLSIRLRFCRICEATTRIVNSIKQLRRAREEQRLSFCKVWEATARIAKWVEQLRVRRAPIEHLQGKEGNGKELKKWRDTAALAASSLNTTHTSPPGWLAQRTTCQALKNTHTHLNKNTKHWKSISTGLIITYIEKRLVVKLASLHDGSGCVYRLHQPLRRVYSVRQQTLSLRHRQARSAARSTERTEAARGGGGICQTICIIVGIHSYAHCKKQVHQHQYNSTGYCSGNRRLCPVPIKTMPVRLLD